MLSFCLKIIKAQKPLAAFAGNIFEGFLFLLQD
jgi:hypothetical protein